MNIFEEDLQNMKKRRAKNVAEITDYDHLRAKTSYKISISRLNTTQYLESFIPSIFQTISCRKSRLVNWGTYQLLLSYYLGFCGRGRKIFRAFLIFSNWDFRPIDEPEKKHAFGTWICENSPTLFICVFLKIQMCKMTNPTIFF